MFFKKLVAAALPVFVLLQPCLSSPILQARATTASSAPLLLPSKDPFYTAAVANLSSYSNGQIIRHRPAPHNLSFVGTGFNLSVDGVYQIALRSSDSLGAAIVVVTTVIVPHNADSTKLLSYQIAYDSADNDCAPSYALQQGSNKTVAETVLISQALRNGWIVNTPDYEGLKAEFTAGIISGRATLDSVRAALASGSFTNVSANAKYAMWGYSGGSLATEWGSELQATYAPELQFAGVALGGLVPNLTSVLLSINRSNNTVLVPNGILGLSAAYTNLSNYVNQHLIPSKAATFKSVLKNCSNAAVFSGQDIFDYFDNGMAILSDPIPKSILTNAGQQGNHGIPTMPLYFYKSEQDMVSPVDDTDALYNKYCATGEVSIDYVKNTVGSHGDEALAGAPGAIAWLGRRFAGLPATNGCTTTIVTI